MLGAARGLYAKKRSAAGIAYVDGATGSTTVASSLTLTAKPAVSGTNRMLVVGVGIEHIGAADAAAITGITWNGTAMTKILATEAYRSGTEGRVELWYLIAPATGSNDLVVTSGATCDAIGAWAMALSGVAQTAPDASTSNNTGAGQDTVRSVTLTTAANNSWIITVPSNGHSASSMAFSSPQVERFDFKTAGTVIVIGGDTHAVATAGSATSTVTCGTLSRMSIVGAAFSPA